MIFKFSPLVVFAFLVPLAAGALYPTKPVQNTQYVAGSTVTTTWKDDGKYPNLDAMGSVEIGLFHKSGRYLATLATNVDPSSKSHEIVIPLAAIQGLPSGQRDYTLHFQASSPYKFSIFTGDFSIVRPEGDPGSPNSSASLTFSSLWSFPGSPQSTASALTAPPFTPGSVQNPSAQQSRNSGSSLWNVDVERLDFWLLFVLWPAVVGISMAA
ncbi:hypothetical protein CONPUDRAFT_144831 [Coniophora puteana RWD-64-598 SS2]|uniref:Uncharacterized protein n=1 Tax=Coniophora puteana (strain RWD-64-598) TaxID=741705 RepID=A0A5M3MKI7_CONPW|nr:uncharacterized protein CONPUDRAFT_144831 [Coniophora puteana RWD-64-598 SS2]EIW79593.1 hypothetical protein CONPUDRAFT_144831 [Coniophora puteana RWD-64-598 SS2]